MVAIIVFDIIMFIHSKIVSIRKHFTKPTQVASVNTKKVEEKKDEEEINYDYTAIHSFAVLVVSRLTGLPVSTVNIGTVIYRYNEKAKSINFCIDYVFDYVRAYCYLRDWQFYYDWENGFYSKYNNNRNFILSVADLEDCLKKAGMDKYDTPDFYELNYDPNRKRDDDFTNLLDEFINTELSSSSADSNKKIMSYKDTFNFVHDMLRDSFGDPDEDIIPEAFLEGDLGLDEIDFCDIEKIVTENVSFIDSNSKQKFTSWICMLETQNYFFNTKKIDKDPYSTITVRELVDRIYYANPVSYTSPK